MGAGFKRLRRTADGLLRLAGLFGLGRAVGCAVLLGSLGTGAPLAAQSLRIGSEKVKLDELPPELPDAARTALDAWLGFAQANEYDLRLDEAGSVLLLSPSGDKKAGRRAKLIEQAVDRLDRILPLESVGTSAASAAAEAEAAAAAAKAANEIPEDPEGDWDDPFAEDDAPEPEPVVEEAGPAAWGSGAPHVPDGETAVLIALRDRDDLSLLLRELVGRFPYLIDWAPEAAGQAGFVLQLPLIGATLIEAPEQEEWHPLNELVNRTSQLLLLRRFGPQPHWIVQGLAWELEISLLDGVYCFPFRTGFVEVGEHTGWKNDLKQRLARLERDLAGEDFMHWSSGSYVDRYARYSWGTVHYLANERPAEFAKLLANLRDYAQEHNRRELDDGTWERIPDFGIPLSVQEERIAADLGADLWSAVSSYFGG